MNDNTLTNKEENYNPRQPRGPDGRWIATGVGSAIKMTRFSKEEAEAKLRKALEDNGIEMKDGLDISGYKSAVSAKVRKELPGDLSNYDPNNPDEYLSSDEYLELSQKRQKRYEELLAKIDKSMGINTETGEMYMTEDDYKQLVNDSGNFNKYDYNFYRTESFSLNDGRAGLSVLENLDGNKPKYWYGNDEEKEYYDSLIDRNKFVKVDIENIRATLAARGKESGVYSLTFPGISRIEERSLKEYNLVPAVNQTLRLGGDTKAAPYIQSAIDKTFSQPQTVYRGLRGDFATQVSQMGVGDTITDKGFMSTSDRLGDTSSEGAMKFGKDGVVMKISTTGGFGNAIDMGPYVSNMGYFDESEVLLNRNTQLKLVSTGETVTVSDGTKAKVMEFVQV